VIYITLHANPSHLKLVEGVKQISSEAVEAERAVGAEAGGTSAAAAPTALTALTPLPLFPLIPPATQALNTTFSQLSSLFRNISYPRAASFSGSRWVMTKLGSISPFKTRSSSGCM
jgi:hypothetical protein